MGARDWFDWHGDYHDPGSRLAERLAAVQGLIGDALDRASPGPVRVVSMCAGQGRDLLGVLVDHPRRADVGGRLVELDPRNARVASVAAAADRLGGVEVVVGGRQGQLGCRRQPAGRLPVAVRRGRPALHLPRRAP